MWAWFHHPDFSIPLIKRRAASEVIEILAGVGDMLVTRGRPHLLQKWYPTDKAYLESQRRLLKKGFLAYVRSRDGQPMLRVTSKAVRQIPDVAKPEALWNRRWNGIWYLLTYDVPEKHAPYRMSLRRFLHHLRMGCLKESTWITPHDIRPEFDDLGKAAGVRDYAVLFEARTVLGMSCHELVQMAWPTARLQTIQNWYCDLAKRHLEALNSGSIKRECFGDFALEEHHAYHSAMALDPLLPRILWPDGYLGDKVVHWHRAIRRALLKSP